MDHLTEKSKGGNTYHSMSVGSLEYEFEDPHAPKSRTTLSQTFVHLVKGYIGPGCLSQPWAYSQIGIRNGIIATLVLGFLSSWNCLLVMKRKVQYVANCPEPERRRHVGYPEIGEVAYGQYFKLYVNFAVCVQQLAICTVYFSFISDNIAAVATQSEWPKLLQNQRFVMSLILPSVLALSFIKDLKKLSPVTAAGTIFLFAAFGLLAAAGIENWDDSSKEVFTTTELKFTQIPLATCAIMYSYEGICLIFPVEAAMIEPEKFSYIFTLAMVCVCFTFAAFATFCVLAFGEIDDGSITAYLMSHLGDYSWEFSILAANVFVSLCVLFTYPLQIFPAIELLTKLRVITEDSVVSYRKTEDMEHISSVAVSDEDFLAKRVDDNISYGTCSNKDFDCDMGFSDRCQGWNSNSNLLRVILVLFTFTLALSVPNVQELISLAGALSGSSVALIIPPLIELHFIYKDGKSTFSSDAVKCFILLSIGIMYGLIGTTVAVLEIFNDNIS